MMATVMAVALINIVVHAKIALLLNPAVATVSKQ